MTSAAKTKPLDRLEKGVSIDDAALDRIFRHARSYSHPKSWTDRPVDDSLLREVWALAKYGPTSANQLPARIVWIKSEAAKARLKPCLDEGNVDKTMSAPVTALIGYDMKFYDKLGYLFPHTDARSWFAGTPEDSIRRHAFQNSSLQGAYLIIAARALGLDCGPMSGFDVKATDKAFFAGTAIQSNFLLNLGYGDDSTLFPRAPRLSFDEATRII